MRGALAVALHLRLQLQRFERAERAVVAEGGYGRLSLGSGHMRQQQNNKSGFCDQKSLIMSTASNQPVVLVVRMRHRNADVPERRRDGRRS